MRMPGGTSVTRAAGRARHPIGRDHAAEVDVSIEINNESGVSVDEVALVELGRYVLDSLSVNPMAELSIVLLDADAMAALHRQWMDVEGPTDVMAFPMDVEELASEHTEPSGPPRPDANGVGALLGDEVVFAEAGSWVFKPRGQWHSFWNAGDVPCEIIEVISPAGFEDYFRELAAIWPDLSKAGPILAKYELDLDPTSVPLLCQRFGLVSGLPTPTTSG